MVNELESLYQLGTETVSDIVATTIEEEPVPTDSEPVSRKTSSSLANPAALAPRSCKNKDRYNNTNRFGYPKHEIGGKLYSFQSNWQIEYPWIEYDSKVMLFFVIYVGGTIVKKSVENKVRARYFTLTGFRNWKAAKDIKKSFRQHSSSDMHIEAQKAHAVFTGIEPDLGDMLIDYRRKQRAIGRKAMMALFDTVITLARNGTSFRGHTPEEGFLNQVLRLISRSGNDYLRNWLQRKTN